MESAIESPGGATKILNLVRTAAAGDIDELNTNKWTPLVGAVFRLGKNTIKNGSSVASQERLVRLIQACHQRGISLNSGAWFGAHYHRPLIVAAYYGYHAAVRPMIEAGALPDLGDGEGRTAWFAAFQNPLASGATHRLRACDERTARVLLDMGVVRKELGPWRRSSPKGSLCHMNGDSSIGSVMLRALLNKNVGAVKVLCGAGGVLTDRDYLQLSTREVKSRLLPMAAEVLAGARTTISSEGETEATEDRPQLLRMCMSWSQQVDWSFPPAWKVGVVLCQTCGLPPEIFRMYVVPFLDRDWFYTSLDLDSARRRPLLGPALGERVGFSRSQEWSNLDGL